MELRCVFLRYLPQATVLYEGTNKEFTDTTALSGKTYYYAVASLDRNLNLSSLSVSQTKLGEKTNQQVIQERAAEENKPATTKYQKLTLSMSLGSRVSEVKTLQQMLSKDIDRVSFWYLVV